jgi:hypothetical protein
MKDNKLSKELANSFRFSHRINLQKKIVISEYYSNGNLISKEDFEKSKDKNKQEKERKISCLNRLNELQDSLEKTLEVKREKNYEIQGIPIDSIIDSKADSIKTFLEDNEIFPSEKGFELIQEKLFNSEKLAKDSPKLNYDFVFSTDQKREINRVGNEDKTWLLSDEGKKSEKNLANKILQKGFVAKRQFEFGISNGKKIISAKYEFGAEIDQELEESYSERIKQKESFLVDQTIDKPLEEYSFKELQITCKAKGLKSSGKKSDLLARITNS